MQGAIMGMRRAEIIRKFDDIVDFAGVKDFIDTPVKRYSSGMNARLGFSVAAHLDPDVLLIDEVLSVGDLSFQEKCFERMQGFVKSGIPIVFVSHNLQAVSTLCDRVLVLRGGQVETLAPTAEAIAAYAALVQQGRPQHGDRHEVTLAVEDIGGRPISTVEAGDQVRVRIAARPRVSGRFQVDLRIEHLQSASLIYRAESRYAGAEPVEVAAGGALEAVWSMTANLGRGHYSIWCTIMSDREGWVARSAPVLLSVHEKQSARATVFMNAACTLRAVAPEMSHQTT
jgi:lipopolysaccharide transport system ATP-binding protein